MEAGAGCLREEGGEDGGGFDAEWLVIPADAGLRLFVQGGLGAGVPVVSASSAASSTADGRRAGHHGSASPVRFRSDRDVPRYGAGTARIATRPDSIGT